MKSSPFLPAFGNRPAYLLGRDAVIEGFVNGLAGPVGHPDRTTILVGQRGMGKTALLLEFASRAESQGFVVVRVTAHDEMLDDIIGAIQRKGTRFISAKSRLKGLSAGAFGFSFGLSFSEEVERSFSFLNKLSLLSEELARHGRGLVILIDEVQANTLAMKSLASAYQSLIGEERDIIIAMAGLLHAISLVLNDDVLTFLNRARKVRLETIPLNSVSTFYARAFRDLKRTITPEVLNSAVCATRGYPYLFQLIGYYLTEYSESGTEIDQQIVDQAIASAKRDLIESIYEPALKPLSKTDSAFLQAMSADRSGVSTIADLTQRLKTTSSNAQAYRRRLLDAGVIASERRGELSFTLPYLGEYLRGEL
ncbi:MAG: AAA family ATPase [Coriobacteriales bacterium]|jgi:hypothetical protein|nr:AAA family ATPase [Coriobacteriales bacterium]